MQVIQGVYSSPFRAFLSAILTKHYLIRPKVLDPAPSLIFLGIRMPTYSCVFYLLFNGGKLQVCFTLSPNSLIVSPSSSFLKTCLYQFLNFIPRSYNHQIPWVSLLCVIRHTRSVVSRLTQEGPSVLHSTADRTPSGSPQWHETTR